MLGTVEEWAKGKNPLVAANAILYASFLNPITPVFQQLKQRRIFKHRLQSPELPSWFALYQSDKSILEVIMGAGTLVSCVSCYLYNCKLHSNMGAVRHFTQSN